MYSVQSPLLSSIHLPALLRLTMRLTRGGALERAGLMAGLKFVPLFGGGFSPCEGASGKLMTEGLGKPVETPFPMIVEALPDSKMPTYTVDLFGLTAIPRGRLPSMVRFVTSSNVEVLKT